jgi:hypothetical protein
VLKLKVREHATINVKTSTMGPRELGAPTINVKTSTTDPGRCQSWRSGSAHHQRENVDDGPLGGARAGDLGAPTINVKTSTAGPREVPELKVQERATINVKTSTMDPREVPELEILERSACGARPSGRAVNGCKNLETNVKE